MPARDVHVVSLAPVNCGYMARGVEFADPGLSRFAQVITGVLKGRRGRQQSLCQSDRM